MTKEHAQEIFTLLKSHYPEAHMILNWGNNFELLVSIILSAQCTDKKVNEVTSVLFPKFRKERKEYETFYTQFKRVIASKARQSSQKDSGQAGMTDTEIIELVNFAHVPLPELEQDIKQTGFYHNKAKSVQGAAQTVIEKYQGILPKTIAEMTTIPGVGRKTANVFLANAYHISEGIAVDTHVMKQSQLLGLTTNKTPEKIEQDLMALFPQDQWYALTYLLIEHGRNKRLAKAKQIRCNNPTCILCQK